MLLEPGVYVYVGSAWGPGGLRARIYRHLGLVGRKRLHWHIDRLLASEYVEPLCVVYAVGCRGEQQAAALLSEDFRPVRGFGATDDRVNDTHLFMLTRLEDCGASPSCISGALLDELVTRLNQVCGAGGAIIGSWCLRWKHRASIG